MTHAKQIHGGIGFDCPYRDDCLLAEERASGATMAVMLAFCCGVVLGGSLAAIVWYLLTKG